MSELRDILAETVTRLFTDLCTKQRLEAADRGEWLAELWTAVEENGLTQPLLPEDKGGVGAGWEAAYVILHASGRFAAPIPLAETLLAGWLLDQAGLDIPAGPLTVVPEVEGVTLSRSDGGWAIGGRAPNVPWAGQAGYLVGIARRDDGLYVYCAGAGAATVESDRNIARDPRCRVTFDGAAEAVKAPAWMAPDTLRVHGAMVRAAQMAGALERIVADTLQYTTERKQFGRPIGKYQVIQQNMAMTAAEVAAAVVAAQNAFRAAERGDPAFEAGCAKILAGEAAGVATDICHETHGAIGFTYEHHLHFFTRRLWSWRGEFGHEAEWAELIGRRAAARGPEALWSDLTARQSGT